MRLIDIAARTDNTRRLVLTGLFLQPLGKQFFFTSRDSPAYIPNRSQTERTSLDFAVIGINDNLGRSSSHIDIKIRFRLVENFFKAAGPINGSRLGISIDNLYVDSAFTGYCFGNFRTIGGFAHGTGRIGLVSIDSECAKQCGKRRHSLHQIRLLFLGNISFGKDIFSQPDRNPYKSGFFELGLLIFLYIVDQYPYGIRAYVYGSECISAHSLIIVSL